MATSRTQARSESKDIGRKYMVEAQELHCSGCGRFLCYQAIIWGVIKIKCPNSRCKEWTTVDISPEEDYNKDGR